MSTEKIEEMREDLIEIFDEEYEKRRIITADFTAIKLADKGYRKQREGEWVKPSAHSDIICSQCNRPPKILFGTAPLYCPNCGARMKGGAE